MALLALRKFTLSCNSSAKCLFRGHAYRSATLTSNAGSSCGLHHLNKNSNDTPVRGQHGGLPQFNDMVTKDSMSSINRYAQSRSFFNLMEKGKFDKKKVQSASLTILNGIYMQAPQNKLREHLELDDSFVIWFCMVNIHIWMIGSRVSREGKDGKLMFETILRIMWEDVEERLKKFEDMTQSNLTWKNRLKNYYREVNLNFHLLDEGIGGSDADLASSLWSILTMKNQTNLQAWHLETLVYYIRQATFELDKLSMEEMILSPQKVVFSFPAELQISETE